MSGAAASPAGVPLDEMKDITPLNSRTVRILGQNPNSFTLNGMWPVSYTHLTLPTKA